MNLHKKAQAVINAIEFHPALGPHYGHFTSALDLDLVDVCSRGISYPIKGTIPVKYTPKSYRLFKKEFDEEFKEYADESHQIPKALITVYIPYEKIYGEPWKFDHVAYFGSMPFSVFKDNNPRKWKDATAWLTYEGVDASGSSFEEMIAQLGKKFFATFGKFRKEDFLTDKEKENHKVHRAHIKHAVGKNRYVLKTNPEYIDVSIAEINLRWARWFLKTEYGKKNWPGLKIGNR